tara:strand:- start:288 stop:1583 length:1296 start_codon:yes stop_codon:yes gene_type:complete
MLLRPSPVFVVSLLLVELSAAYSADVALVQPEVVGLSATRLDRITQQLEKLVETEQLAGGVTLVARRGQVAHLTAVGWQDKENHIPMRQDAIFRIASMSKAITSVAAMLLYEEGHFRLTDPVANFIPEFSQMRVLAESEAGSGEVNTVAAKREITIHDLLTHTSGIVYQSNTELGEQYNRAGIPTGLLEDSRTIGENVRALAAIPLLHQPGERFTYGLNTDVLGRVIEVVSGLPLDQFLQERLFGPLQMASTRFFIDEKDAGRLATVYARQEGKLQRETRQKIDDTGMIYSTSYPVQGSGYFSGGAGLCSTAMDYYRFCQMLLDNGRAGHSRILSRKTVELMTTEHVSFDPEDLGTRFAGFGLGFQVRRRLGLAAELGSQGSYGWGGFFYTVFLIDPQEELIMVSLAQLHPSGGLDWNSRFPTLVYQAIDD